MSQELLLKISSVLLGQPIFRELVGLLTDIREERSDPRDEALGLSITGSLVEEQKLLVKVLGISNDVGETGLSRLGLNGVVDGIGVGHKGAGEGFTKDGLSDGGGTMLVDMEEGEIGVAGKPEESVVAVLPP